MATHADKDAQLAHLAAVTAWVTAQPADPEPDPLPTGNKVVDVTAVPGERSLDIKWTPPGGATAIVVDWADETGPLASSGPLLGTANALRIANLRPVPHTVGISVSQAVDLQIDPTSLVTLRDLVPLPTPTPGTDWPAGGSWDQKRDWTVSVAGAPDSGLQVVASAGDLARLKLPGSWNAAQRFWDLPAGLQPGTFDGLDVRGEIYVRGLLPDLHSVKCQGLRFARDNNANNGRTLRITECGFTRHPTFPIGNGALNTWGRPVLILKRCDFSGHADGIQHAGRLECEASYFHDPAYMPETHNDFCQGYSGSSEKFTRCYMVSSSPNANNQNGLIFTDGPSPAGADVIDSVIVVKGPNRATNWACNASSAPYRFLRCLIDGKIVGRGPVTRTECDYRP